eukprot:scaffold219010_cov17-Tisochrysis_lutea.AAC.1
MNDPAALIRAGTKHACLVLARSCLPFVDLLHNISCTCANLKCTYCAASCATYRKRTHMKPSRMHKGWHTGQQSILAALRKRCVLWGWALAIPIRVQQVFWTISLRKHFCRKEVPRTLP